jgi:hypothetical protein
MYKVTANFYKKPFETPMFKWCFLGNVSVWLKSPERVGETLSGRFWKPRRGFPNLFGVKKLKSN